MRVREGRNLAGVLLESDRSRASSGISHGDDDCTLAKTLRAATFYSSPSMRAPRSSSLLSRPSVSPRLRDARGYGWYPVCFRRFGCEHWDHETVFHDSGTGKLAETAPPKNKCLLHEK